MAKTKMIRLTKCLVWGDGEWRQLCLLGLMFVSHGRKLVKLRTAFSYGYVLKTRDISYLKAGNIILSINFSSATILFCTCKIRIPVHSHIIISIRRPKVFDFQRNISIVHLPPACI